MKKTLSPRTQSQLEKAMVHAAIESGKVLLKYFGKKFQIREKFNAGLVTNADLEAEEKSKKILKKAFPSFGFITEEAKPEAIDAEGVFVIDPLDGTTNFVHGFPMFCVSIGAKVGRHLEAGVIQHPVLNDLYVAVRGKGAKLNGKKIQVSKTRKIKDSLLTTGFTYRHDEWIKSEMSAFESLSKVARAVRRPGSAALDLAYTARGVFDGFWERRLSPWDVAAGALLVMEAGGMVTDFHGGDFDLFAQEIIATNGKIHPSILKEIKQSQVAL